MTTTPGPPAADARAPATGRVGGRGATDPDDHLAHVPADHLDDGTPVTLGERIAAWFAPTPAELVALVILLVGSVAVTLLWWYGSVTAPADPTPAATAGGLVGNGVTPGDPPDGTDGVAGGGAPLGSAGVPAADGGAGAGTAQGTVMVHVSGAVQRPGLVALPAGARVGDAVAAVGGLTEDADGPGVNLARVLVDGEQVHVPVEGEERPTPPAGDPGAGAGPAAGEGSGGSDPQGRVDLNRASASELESLPGIGPTRAAAIVAHREQHGPFPTPGDLRAVSGIGEATFQNLAPLIVVR